MKARNKETMKDTIGLVTVLILVFGAIILMAYFWTTEHEGEEPLNECDSDDYLCVEWEE